MNRRWWRGLAFSCLLACQFSFAKEEVLLRCRSSGASGSTFKEIRLTKIGGQFHLWYVATNTTRAARLLVNAVQQTPVGTYYDLGVDKSTNRRLFLVSYGKQGVILYNNDEVLMINENQSPILEQGDNGDDNGDNDEPLAPLDWSQVALIEFFHCF